MAHGVGTITEEDIKDIVKAKPFVISSVVQYVLWGIIALGTFVFIKGTISDKVHTWASFQVNFTYWFALAAASTCFSAVLQICNGQWARTIRRLFEASSNFLLISALIPVVLYFGHTNLFSWAHHPVAGKEIWLSSKFLYLRDILAILFLAFVARKFVFLSIQRDIGAIRGGLTGVSKEDSKRWYDKAYDKYVDGWAKDSIREIEAVSAKMSKLAPFTMIVFCLVLSFIAFDQIMSVEPHWYSTLFGVLYFMSGAYIAMAWCCICFALIRDRHPIFLSKIKQNTLHDLGKLLFGFGIFWAYMFWSHYLPFWYGNLPEETGWLITRVREKPWHCLAWITLGLCFIVPFLIGLSRDVKRVPALLLLLGLIVAAGIWLQLYILFVPTLFPHYIPLSLTDIFITMAFMSAYLLSVFSFLKKAPLIPFGDMY